MNNNPKRLQYSQEVHTVRAATPTSGTERSIDLQYADAKVIGNGSFGVVYRANLVHNNEDVAIKKVLQDKRFKNRELQIMRKLDHRNVVKLKYFFYSTGEKKDEVYLNLILEYVPETVYRVARHYAKQRQIIPILYIKVYIYQLFRALGYIHNIGICHRDIKPQNLLLNAQTSVLKLCDFGSAKMLVPGEPNVAYICSRYYRAPELIFGATDYTTKIDVWSAGTVLAELLLGSPFFPGDSGVDQLVEIIKVLGTPSRDEIQQMNPNYTEFRFPMIRPHPWSRVFRARTPQDAIDLVSKLLKYTPNARLSPYEAIAHEFFDELRSPNCKLPSSNPMPPLFDFTEAEQSHIEASIQEKLQPKFAQNVPNIGGNEGSELETISNSEQQQQQVASSSNIDGAAAERNSNNSGGGASRSQNQQQQRLATESGATDVEDIIGGENNNSSSRKKSTSTSSTAAMAAAASANALPAATADSFAASSAPLEG